MKQRVKDAIDPFYIIGNLDEWYKIRTDADIAELNGTEEEKKLAYGKIQSWIIKYILVKGSTTSRASRDKQIQNYQNTLNHFKFLYQYANTDPCNAVAVMMEFRELAYNFWYHYPKKFDFLGSEVRPISEDHDAYRLTNQRWEEEQRYQCTEGLKPPLQQTFDMLGHTIKAQSPMTSQFGIMPVITSSVRYARC